VIITSSTATGLSNGSTFPIGTTIITYEVWDVNGNSTTHSFEVIVNELPVVSILNGTEIEICIGEASSLQVDSPNQDLSYSWSLYNSSVGTGPSYSLSGATESDNGFYSVEAIDSVGCVAQASVEVTIISCDIKIPEAITPNGNGVNEMFIIEGIAAYPNTELIIFNRWGSKVYESKDYQNEWDGSSQNNLNIGGNELPEGTYFYIMKLGGTEGEETYGKIYKGYVYIKR
jgi:gliding motility-associated-like protein